MAAGSPVSMRAAATNRSATQAGPVLQAEALADTAGGATLATLIADHNTLLARLRTAGVLSA